MSIGTNLTISHFTWPYIIFMYATRILKTTAAIQNGTSFSRVRIFFFFFLDICWFPEPVIEFDHVTRGIYYYNEPARTRLTEFAVDY